jgi:hypothetical protein
MLVLARVSNNLFNLGRGDVLGVDPANPHSLAMDLKHDLCGLFPTQREERLQNGDNELHWSVIVVEENDFEKGRGLELAFPGLK